jgi:V8-like Glu-specific endopeptidase
MLSSLTRRLPKSSPRRRACRPTLEPLEERLALSLTALTDTTTYPGSAAVQMEIDFHGHLISCSGALIDPDHVLTAAHCLYDPTYGMADSVTVYAGRNGTNVEPFGVAYGTQWVVHANYVQGPYAGRSEFDLGLIALDRKLGMTVGYLGVSAQYPDSYFNNGGNLVILEYPGDTHSGVNEYLGGGPALNADANNVYWNLSDIPIEHGSSGSPVYVKADDGSRYIVAVVSELSATEGIATRITNAKLNWIIDEINGNPSDSSAAPPPAGPSTPGLFDPRNATWYLRNSSSPGTPDAGAFTYGGAGWMPVAGDWNGDGVTTAGVVDPNGTWYLENNNRVGAPDIAPFAYGTGSWVPVVGDWDGNGTTTIGMFDPSTATWYLRNSNSPGAPDIVPFKYGAPGWIPVVGDWNGDGQTSIGVVDPATMTWYLRNENSAGAPDFTPFQYGAPGWIPVVGDWNSDGMATVGVVDPKTETWYLRNENSPGAPDYAPFAYGAPGWFPLAGNWRGIATGLHTPTVPAALDRGVTDAALYAIATANPALLGTVPAATSQDLPPSGDFAGAVDGGQNTATGSHGTGDPLEFTQPWAPAADDDPLQVKLG